MTEEFDPERAPRTDYDRYRLYETGDGQLVLYDGENDHAWVQTDTTVELRR